MPAPHLRQKRVLAATVTVVVVGVAAAWALQALAGDDEAYEITVTRGGKTEAVLGLEDLRALPSRTVEMQGQEQSGPTLLSVLAEADIERFRSVRVIGMGVRDDGVIVLLPSQLDEDVLLDIAERGTTKVCGPEIPWADRVRDVQRIEVR